MQTTPTPTPTKTKRPRRSPLPDLARHPAVLLATIVVPQLILLVINLRSYHLISEEVSDKQRNLALWIFAGELTLLIGGALFAGWQWRRGPRLAWAWNWSILVPHIAFLSFAAMNIHQVIPGSLQLWIVQPESLVYYHFVLLMPAIFYTALALACFPTRIHKGIDLAVSAVVAASIPFGWYVISHLNVMWFWDIPEFMIISMVAGSSMICLTGFLRILTVLFTWAASKGQVGQVILVFLMGLACPIAGLITNAYFSFPADFQSWQVYVLTVVNGVLLMIPPIKRPGWDRAIWMAQCALLPFSLYFFFVFLPFIPVAAIATIAFGAGFLILAPTALFIIHIKRVAQGIKLGQPVWLAAIAAAVIPLYMFAEAKFDRVVMNQAIDYVFAPDFERDQFSGSRLAVRRSLHRLRDIKDGAYMPFLTEFYNAAVFNNLVLNDRKMQILHRAFFGEEIKNLNEESDFGDLFGRRRGRNGSGRTVINSPRPAEAKLVQVTSKTTPEGSGTRTLVKLEMHNPTPRQSEFATVIQVPPGVFVSGYWLDVEGDRVPGQIFERKTAMWVYRMIRDVTRRDPGLLTYTGPNSLQLRVFPFAGNQTRITEIEFLAPAGVAADVRIGDQIVDANAEIPSGSSTTITPAGDDDQLVSLDREALAALPSVTREPYLHFVVDRSLNSDEPAEILATLELIARQFPGIEDCKITAANFEFQKVSDGITPIADIGNLRDRNWIKPRGALLQDLAIKRILANERSTKPNRRPLRTPVIVVVANDETEAIADHKLVDFATTTPDINHFYIWKNDKLIARSFDGGEIIRRPREVKPKPVKLLVSSGYVAPVLANAESASVLLPKGEIRALDGKGGAVPAAAGAVSKPSRRFADAAKTWALSDQLQWNPSTTAKRLPELVSLSRETGTLVPATAYIVVENSAQWKMLKRKEKQKLKGNHGLDFMESPEPALWVVAVIFGAGVLMTRRLQWKSRKGSAGDRSVAPPY